MKKSTTIPGRPAKRATDFELDEFKPSRFTRVIYVPQESRPDRKVIEAQAFEVDITGKFIAAPNGAPSRTSGSLHSIEMSGVGDTHTLVPAWVRIPPPAGISYKWPAAGETSNLPDGTTKVTTMPATGTEGQHVWLEPNLYRWDLGMVENIMKGKAKEMIGLLTNSQASADFEL